MAELKLPRLLAAAKEFNIGQDTLIDFLSGKGFHKDDLKPTSKLSEEMYRSLQQEFSSDKAAKIKSDQLELPKGSQVEAKKKREDEEISFKKEEKPSVKITKKEEAKPVEEEKPAKAKEQKEETTPPVPAKEEEVTKIKTPEIEGPKVVKKIDLSTIDSSTRPKKTTKAKKEEEVKPVVEEKAGKGKAKKTKKEEEEVKPAAEKTVSKEEPVAEEHTTIIENIEVEKLTGPKILGKIDLPLDSDTRPVKDEKKKRKRIPIEKKDNKREIFINKDTGGDRRTGGGTGGGNFNRGRGGSTGGANRGGGGRTSGTGGRREDKLIDEKEIQRKIQETQAKLAGGGGRGKNLKAKMRREKRQELADAQGETGDDNKLQVTEFISVSELANLMDVSFAEVISKCMSLGIMVSINQRLDAEVIELVASEFGYDVEFIDMEKQMEMEEENDADHEDELKFRSPIVTIMGHVDHGKTSLLDYIRSANVVAGEAGGITQHIGAYQVELANGKQITFLDTPGHEAFTAMRARGAKVTDIAVIVIAADDAVMPQTREAISHAQAAGVPMIFAINKIDKDGANSKKIYEQLSQMNILVEEWGGKFQSQEIAAKKGLNVDKLLEKILLEAEILDLKANPDREATGTIIEASLDKGRGYVATLLVENGTLHPGDLIVSGQYFGRVKAMFNERNKKEEEAGPSAPAVILGLNGAPQAGEKFKVYEDEAEAKEIAYRRAQILREQGIRTKKHITLDEIGRRLALGSFKELKVIIKGDVDGSVEALSDSLQKLSTPEILVSVIHKGVGQINESDIVLAEASDAIVIAFNVRPSLQASKLADNVGIEIKMYSIIYNAIEEVKSAMEGMLEPKVQEKIVANVEIREVFKFDKATVAGCTVRDGKIKRDSKIRLIRDGIVIYPSGEGGSAELGSLKRFKDDAKEVLSGMECGLTIKNFTDYKVGDVVEAYEIEEVKRTL
ncbi:MAG: translation initiation factor IF-2 [Chitinophagaceae bacterium]|nr:translation initiation factor IF-2 [Chitinophagaceae bacterium]